MATSSQKVIELLITAIDQASPELKKVSNSINQLIGATEKVSKGMAGAGNATDNLGKKAKTASGGIDKGKKSLDAFGDSTGKAKISVASLAAQLAIVGAAVAAILWPVKQAAEFEYSMAQVGVVSQSTGATLQGLSDFAMEMGQVTLFSAKEAADGMQLLALAGLSVSQIMETLPNVLNLAVIGNMSVAESAKLATNILYGFGLEASNMTHVIDALAYTATQTKSTIQDLGYGMSYVAPIAASLGVDFNELTAAMGLLNNAGIEASRAGTSLRMGLGRLLNPSKQAAEAMGEVASRIGQASINVLDAEGNFIGLEAIVRQLEGAGLTAGEALKIFGQRAGPGMAALVNQGADALELLADGIKNSDGTAQEFSDTLIGTLQGSLKIIQGHFSTLATIVGTSLIPEVKSIASEIDIFILAITRLATQFPTLTGYVTLFATAASVTIAATIAWNLATLLFTRTAGGALIATLAKSVVGVVAYTTSVVTGTAATGLFADALISLKVALGFLSANWIVLAITAIAAGIYYWVTATDRAVEASKRHSAELNKTIASSNRYQAELTKLIEMEERGADVTEKKEDAIRKLREQFPELASKISLTTGELKQYNDALEGIESSAREEKIAEDLKLLGDTIENNFGPSVTNYFTNFGEALVWFGGEVAKIGWENLTSWLKNFGAILGYVYEQADKFSGGKIGEAVEKIKDLGGWVSEKVAVAWNYWGEAIGGVKDNIVAAATPVDTLKGALDRLGVGYDLVIKNQELFDKGSEKDKKAFLAIESAVSSLSKSMIASGASTEDFKNKVKDVAGVLPEMIDPLGEVYNGLKKVAIENGNVQITLTELDKKWIESAKVMKEDTEAALAVIEGKYHTTLASIDAHVALSFIHHEEAEAAKTRATKAYNEERTFLNDKYFNLLAIGIGEDKATWAIAQADKLEVAKALYEEDLAAAKDNVDMKIAVIELGIAQEVITEKEGLDQIAALRLEDINNRIDIAEKAVKVAENSADTEEGVVDKLVENLKKLYLELANFEISETERAIKEKERLRKEALDELDLEYKLQLAAIANEVANEVITVEEGAKKKLKAELEFLKKKMEMTTATFAAIALKYAEDTEEYKQALLDKIAAETAYLNAFKKLNDGMADSVESRDNRIIASAKKVKKETGSSPPGYDYGASGREAYWEHESEGREAYWATHATGGEVGGGLAVGPSHANGGILAEFEGGEYIHPITAVQHYGKQFMDSIRNLTFPKFKDGGLISNLRALIPKFPDGGLVSNIQSFSIAAIENEGSNEIITVKEEIKKKLELELEFLKKKMEMTTATFAAIALKYAEDTEEYKQSLLDKITAETDYLNSFKKLHDGTLDAFKKLNDGMADSVESRDARIIASAIKFKSATGSNPPGYDYREYIQAAYWAQEAEKSLATYATGGEVGGGLAVGASHANGGILAEFEGGEYIHPIKAVQHYGRQFMESIRNLTFPKFSDGGLVSNIRSLIPKFPDGGILQNTDFSNIMGALSGNNNYLTPAMAGSNNTNYVRNEDYVINVSRPFMSSNAEATAIVSAINNRKARFGDL